MKIVIAIDSFKGCASSNELAQHIEKGIKKVYEDSKVIICPIADGGEGTVEALSSLKNSRLITASCSNPLGKKIQAQYVMLEDNTAVIEMASASGLPLIAVGQRDPSITSTEGTGDLIKDAIKKGAREFIVGIGGSATNDAGLGMLRSLGFRFLDKNGIDVCYAKDLGKIVKIDKSESLKELKECKFKIACDVNNPLYGEKGAAHIYAKQKGASDSMILDLDEGLKKFAKVVLKGSSEQYDKYPGSGAAGGLGFGFLAFLNSELKSGIKIILEKLELKDKIKNADFVITGEGKIDKQSAMGKVLNGIGLLCKEESTTCIALSGNTSEADTNLHEIGISAFFSIVDAPMSLKEAMNRRNTLDLIEKRVEQIFRVIKFSKFD